MALKLDVTHRKRVLRGTVAVRELVITKGLILLLRDERGDLVRVGVNSGPHILQHMKACCFARPGHTPVSMRAAQVSGSLLCQEGRFDEAEPKHMNALQQCPREVGIPP